MPFCCGSYESSVRRHQSAHFVSSQNGMTGKKSTPHDDVQVFKFNLYSFMFTCGTPFCTPHFFTICSVRGHGGQTTTAAVGTHRATVFVYTATRSRCIGPVPMCRLGCRMRCDTGIRSVCSANSHPSTVPTHHAAHHTDSVLVPNMLSPDRSCHTPTMCLPFCGHDRSLEVPCRFEVGALLAASIKCRICRLPVVRSDVCIQTCVTELAQGVMKSTACVMNSHSAS